MKPHLKKQIMKFELRNGSSFTGCRSGLIILNRNLNCLESILKLTTNKLLSFSNLDLKKLRSFENMEQYTQDHDTIKIGNQYFSAFRLYALLNEVGYKKGSVEIFNAIGKDFPILIKANNKEMLLAPNILNYDLEERDTTIPDIKSFGNLA